MREDFGSELPRDKADAYANREFRLREKLGEVEFTAAWDDGHWMTPEEVVTAEPKPASTTVRARDYPAALTYAEVKVLRWVAKGLTDKQVASILVLSVRTVQTQLRDARRKIRRDNRNAASRWVQENIDDLRVDDDDEDLLDKHG